MTPTLKKAIRSFIFSAGDVFQKPAGRIDEENAVSQNLSDSLIEAGYGPNGNSRKKPHAIVHAAGVENLMPIISERVGLDENNIVGMALNVLNFGQNKTFGGVRLELANTLLTCGHPDMALALFKSCLVSTHSVQAHQSYLLCLLLAPKTRNQDLLAAAKQYAHIYDPAETDDIPDHDFDFTLNKRLRIGYICEFFESSVMASGMLGILKRFDRNRFEIFCYSDGRIPDAHRDCADCWQETFDDSDIDLLHRIRADKIDILVDLSGPVAKCRAKTFAMRAAPIQVGGPNYSATGGAPHFDVMFASETLIPIEQEKFFTERIIRNPLFIGYSLPNHDTYEEQVPVSPPPIIKNGGATLGYFGSSHKLNEKTIQNWSTILKSLPNTRILLKAGGFDHAAVRVSILKMFKRYSIGEDRVELRGLSPYKKMLEEYKDVDIALEPYPATGGSTLNDALWQGVPCVTIRGDRMLSLSGPSRLEACGFKDLITKDLGACIAKIESLISNTEKLTAMRKNQRNILLGSNLFDRKGFMQALEGSLIKLWKEKCKINPTVSL